MPETSDQTATAVCYPPESLYEQWCSDADRVDQSKSRFIIRMVEAGRKDVSIDGSSTESIREVLQEQARLKRKLKEKRTRVRELEQQLEHTAHSDISSFIAENPGINTPEIIQHVANTVPNRVAGYLDMLEGSVIEYRDGEGYYRIGDE